MHKFDAEPPQGCGQGWRGTYQTLTDVVIDGFNGGVELDTLAFSRLTNTQVSGFDTLVMAGSLTASEWFSSHLRAFRSRVEASEIMIAFWDAFSSFNFLGALTAKRITIQHSSFESIPFDAFAAPFGLESLYINNNPNLHDVDGLAALRQISTNVDISNNPKLRSIAGLCGLEAPTSQPFIVLSTNGQLCNRDISHIFHANFGFDPNLVITTGLDTAEQCPGFGCSCASFASGSASPQAQCDPDPHCVVRAGVQCFGACLPGQVFNDLNMTCEGDPIIYSSTGGHEGSSTGEVMSSSGSGRDSSTGWFDSSSGSGSDSDSSTGEIMSSTGSGSDSSSGSSGSSSSSSGASSDSSTGGSSAGHGSTGRDSGDSSTGLTGAHSSSGMESSSGMQSSSGMESSSGEGDGSSSGTGDACSAFGAACTSCTANQCTACAVPAINVDGMCRVCDLACQNNGKCTLSSNGQFCACPAGFSGALCQTAQTFDFDVVTETKLSSNTTIKRMHFAVNKPFEIDIRVAKPAGVTVVGVDLYQVTVFPLDVVLYEPVIGQAKAGQLTSAGAEASLKFSYHAITRNLQVSLMPLASFLGSQSSAKVTLKVEFLLSHTLDSAASTSSSFVSKKVAVLRTMLPVLQSGEVSTTAVTVEPAVTLYSTEEAADEAQQKEDGAGSDGLSEGAITGIVIGSVLGAVALLAFGIFCMRHRSTAASSPGTEMSVRN